MTYGNQTGPKQKICTRVDGDKQLHHELTHKKRNHTKNSDRFLKDLRSNYLDLLVTCLIFIAIIIAHCRRAVQNISQTQLDTKGFHHLNKLPIRKCILWKSVTLCKLWKLKTRPQDDHPIARGRGGLFWHLSPPTHPILIPNFANNFAPPNQSSM